MITYQISCKVRPIPGIIAIMGGLREVASVLMMIITLLSLKVLIFADVALVVKRRAVLSVSPQIRLIFVEI